MSRLCKNCGMPINFNAKFCSSCGEKVLESNPPVKSVSLNNGRKQALRCQECDTEINTSAKFCKICGKELQAITKQQSDSSMHPTDPNTGNRKKQLNSTIQKKKRRKLWIPITAVVTALALVFTLVLINGNKDQNELQINIPDKAVLIEKDIISKGLISPGGPALQSTDGTVTMMFDALCIDDEVEAKIVKLDVENPPDGNILNVYDFSIDSKEKISGVITIEVPYDPTQIPAGRTVDECVSGVYYDENLHEWIEESYTIDELRNTVIIKTVHLSPHGSKITLNDDDKRLLDLFISVSAGTPYEYVIPKASDKVLGRLTQEEMVELIEELKMNGAADPQQTLNDTSMKILGESGNFSDIGVKTFKLTSYAGKWAAYLETTLGELSGALVLAQLASDVYYEKPQAETYFNLLKGLSYWKGAALAASLGGPIGGTIATVVLTGMFLYEFFVDPIDIPKYIEESNHQTIVDAYYMYYHSEENYRSKNEWMEKIDMIVNKAYREEESGNGFDNIFKKLLDEEVTAYATHFFNIRSSEIQKYVKESFDIKQGYLGSYDRVYSKKDQKRNEEYVAEYVTEILSGQYEGTTTSLQDELINKLKQEIYTDTLPVIMDMRKEYQYLKQLEYFRQAQKKMSQYFNTQFSLLIKDGGCKSDEVSEYAEFYVVPKTENQDSAYQLEKWIVQLNERGEGQLNYNLIAHQMAGDFTALSLYNKDDYDKILLGTAEPVKILDIGVITSNEHQIIFGKEAVDITITGERSITYETADDQKVSHTFEAISDYTDECSIKWNFGDGSEEIETDGNQSITTHEYENEGVFTVTAKIFDDNAVELAEDVITLEIENQSNRDEFAITYTGIIPFSSFFNFNDEDGNYFTANDQPITITYSDGVWGVAFNYSSVSGEKWAPSTDVTRETSSRVDIDNLNSSYYHGEASGLRVKSGTYQGNDVSDTEKINFTMNLNWYEEDKGNLVLNFEFDIYHFDIELTK